MTNKQKCIYFSLITLSLAFIGRIVLQPRQYHIKPQAPVIGAHNAEKQAQTSLYVEREAVKQGVNPKIALFIAGKESEYDPSRIGDDKLICKATGLKQRSRGLWQISDCYQPQVSDACAFDVSCSTNWALKEIKAGHLNLWSTWKFRKLWYKDYPI